MANTSRSAWGGGGRIPKSLSWGRRQHSLLRKKAQNCCLAEKGDPQRLREGTLTENQQAWRLTWQFLNYLAKEISTNSTVKLKVIAIRFNPNTSSSSSVDAAPSNIGTLTCSVSSASDAPELRTRCITSARNFVLRQYEVQPTVLSPVINVFSYH